MDPTVRDLMQSISVSSIPNMYGAQSVTPSWFKMDDHIETNSGAVYLRTKYRHD